MPVQRRYAAAVVDDDRIAVAGNPSGIRYDARRRRENRIAVVAADVHAAVVTARAVNRMNTPAIFRRDLADKRPNHRARTAARILVPARPDQPLDLRRRRNQFLVRLLRNFAIGFHPCQQTVLIGLPVQKLFVFFLRRFCKARLIRALLFQRRARLLHDALFRLHFPHQLRIAGNHALEEIHARQEIREIFRAEKHVDIIDLPVHIDIADAPAKLRDLVRQLRLRLRQ